MGGGLGEPEAGGQLCAVVNETSALPSLLRMQLSGGGGHYIKNTETRAVGSEEHLELGGLEPVQRSALLRRQKLGEKREELGWGGGRGVNARLTQKEYSRGRD